MTGGTSTPTPWNVAIYARVSTEHDAQLSALENQLDWYKPILEQHPEWVLVHSYVDEGITGTSANKRPQFMRMLADAEKGEFDLILTREVSRFARNTVDTLQYTRQLKAIGVEVYFINDNIRTFDGDGELRLTIMATLAQDESRKTSIRVKSGQQTSMENGVYYGNGNILGYDRVGKDLTINPEQARTVRRIYDLYLSGMGLRQIQFTLEAEGHLTATGKTRWYESNISKILRNPFYAGIIEYHKQFTPNYLEQKKINNFGEIERLRVKGRHEPIITVEEFEQVQALLERKRQQNPANKTGRRSIGKKLPLDVWCKLLVCSCGCTFNRTVWHTISTGVQYGYTCYSQNRNGTIRTRLNKGLPIEGYCTSQMISGWKLQMMAKHLFQRFLRDTDRILELAKEMLAKHIRDQNEAEDNTALLEKKRAELSKLEKRLTNLISMRADGEIDKAQFQRMKSEVDERIRALQEQIGKLAPPETAEEQPDYDERLTILGNKLSMYLDFDADEDIPEQIIEAFVEKIVVSADTFAWYLLYNGRAPMSDKEQTVLPEKEGPCLPETGNKPKATPQYIQIGGFTLHLGDAKSYLYAKSTKRRILNWRDLDVNVYI